MGKMKDSLEAKRRKKKSGGKKVGDAVRDNLRMAGRFRDGCVSSQVMVRQGSCWCKNLWRTMDQMSPCVTMFLEICGSLQSMGKPLWNQDMM